MRTKGSGIPLSGYMSDLNDVRRRYAEEIRDVLKARFGIALSKPLVDAFGKVSREHFLGPGPWVVRGIKKNTWQSFTWSCAPIFFGVSKQF